MDQSEYTNQPEGVTQNKVQNKRRVSSQSDVNQFINDNIGNNNLRTLINHKDKQKTQRNATINYPASQRQRTTPRKTHSIYKNSFNIDDGDFGIRDQKTQILEKLTLKNRKLKKQIYAIQRAQQERINMSKQKRQRSVDQLYYAFSTKESLTKELNNVYAKIKRYQSEIKQTRKVDTSAQSKKISHLQQTVQQVESVKKERSKNLEKLKRTNKRIQDKIDNYKKGQFEYKFKIMIKQIQHLRQKQRQMKAIQNKRKQQIEKQKTYIGKVEKQLLSNGVAKQFINDLRSRIISGEQEKQKQQNAVKVMTKKQMHQQFKKFKRQIQITQKLIKQQQKTLTQLTQKQKIASLAEQKTLQLSIQLDEEINKTEQHIAEVRKKINRIHLKPKPLPPKDTTKQDQKNKQLQHLKQVRKKFFDRKKNSYFKRLQNIEKASNQFDPSRIEFDNQNQKYSQIKMDDLSSNIFEKYGKNDQKNYKFSDENTYQQLANLSCKMTGIKVLFTNVGIINGIKSEYNHQYSGTFHKVANYIEIDQQEQNFQEKIQNDKNVILSQKQEIQSYTCSESQWITQINGKFSNKSELIYLQIITNTNGRHQFNKIKNQSVNEQSFTYFCVPSKKDLQIKYIIGSLNSDGICQFGACLRQIQSKNQEMEIDQEN